MYYKNNEIHEGIKTLDELDIKSSVWFSTAEWMNERSRMILRMGRKESTFIYSFDNLSNLTF